MEQYKEWFGQQKSHRQGASWSLGIDQHLLLPSLVNYDFCWFGKIPGNLAQVEWFVVRQESEWVVEKTHQPGEDLLFRMVKFPYYKGCPRKFENLLLSGKLTAGT